MSLRIFGEYESTKIDSYAVQIYLFFFVCLLLFSLVLDLTLTLKNPVFNMSAVQVFWKHCGKKEKLLVGSNFSFFRTRFYPFEELCSIFIKSKIVVC